MLDELGIESKDELLVFLGATRKFKLENHNAFSTLKSMAQIKATAALEGALQQLSAR